MKYLTAIFFLGISCFLFACGDEADEAREHYHRGLDYQQQGKMNEAIAEWKIAITIKPDWKSPRIALGTVYTRMGLSYQRQGKLDEAIAEYKRAIAVAPRSFKERYKSYSAIAHYHLANAYLNQGRLDDATEEYKRAIWEYPHFRQAHMTLGHIYTKQGRLNAAIEQYKIASYIFPDEGPADASLGLTYSPQRETAEAYYNLAYVYSLQDKRDLLIESLRKAITLDKSYIEKAKTNKTFDTIRDSPEFQNLIHSLE